MLNRPVRSQLVPKTEVYESGPHGRRRHRGGLLDVRHEENRDTRFTLKQRRDLWDGSGQDRLTDSIGVRRPDPGKNV